MARIKNIELPGEKHTCIGLTAIYGIGRSLAVTICENAGVATDKKIKDLIYTLLDYLSLPLGYRFWVKLFDKKIDGFGEIFRHQSYIEIGSGALLSRATAGVYKKCCIFSMPGSPNAVKTALNIIIDELPHIVHHAKK